MIEHNISKFRDGFSMVTAVLVIIIMASITALIMNLSSKTLKVTTVQYQKEQASLLARSYTELAMLYVINHDRSSNNCIESIDASFGDPNNLYTIKTNIKYIGNKQLQLNCPANISDINSSNMTRFNSTVSLVIDVYITYKDFDDPSDRNITFYRRTVQKL